MRDPIRSLSSGIRDVLKKEKMRDHHAIKCSGSFYSGGDKIRDAEEMVVVVGDT